MTAIAEIVSLADAKRHLRMTTTADDAELTDTIAEATAIVEDIIGPCLARVITDESHDGGTENITLRTTPIVSVESVTVWVAQTPYVHTYDPLAVNTTFHTFGWRAAGPYESGTIVFTSSGFPVPSFIGRQNVLVSYTAGRSSLSPTIVRGSKELIRHLWETQRGRSMGRPVPGYDEQLTTTASGYTVPNRVLEALRGQMMTPGIA